MTSNVVTYLKTVQNNKKHGALHGMVVAKNLHDVMPRLFVQLIGGFLTTSAWVHKALLKQSIPPEGVFYKGLSRLVHFTFFLSKRLRESSNLKMIVDISTALSSPGTTWKVRFVTKPVKLIDACKTYISEHGPRSRPSTSIAALCLDDEDKRSLQSGVQKEYRNLFHSLRDFLDATSHVDRGVACAGRWKFG